MRNGLPVTIESASAVRRICPPPSPNEPSMFNIASSLHAYDLMKGMHDFDEILLRRHYRVDRLVGRRRLVNHIDVFSALDTRSRRLMIGDRESSSRFSPRHASARTVTAAHEAVRVAEAAHDVRPRAHATRHDPEIAQSRAHGTPCA
jgi:hypothetical protein